MGLSWQQGPLSATRIGRFLVPDPLPERMLYAEPLRRRMRVRYADEWIADSEDVVLLHEPGRYPVAYFPRPDVRDDALLPTDRTTRQQDLGETSWFTVRAGDRRTERPAWELTALPEYAGELKDRVAFAWRAMDAFYEEDERILGHAADAYHRIDIRDTSRTLEVRSEGRVVARSEHPVVLYESGFAPRWYVPRAVDCERTCTGSHPRNFPAERWLNQSIDTFLWGWIRLLGRRIDGTDLLHEQAPGRPGRRGLAYQLDTIRTTPPTFDPVLAGSTEISDDVDSVRDLRMYAGALATDFGRDRREVQARISRGEWAHDGGSWAHGILYNWLGAWAAWVNDTPLSDRLEPVTWRSVALQLSAARIYE